MHQDTSPEEKMIADLEKNNTEKFKALHDIITTEIQQTKTLKDKVQDIQNIPSINQVDAQTDGRIEAYNEQMKPFNDKFVDATKDLLNPKTNLPEEFKAS